MLFSLLLAFSLSLDALGIGLSYGLRSIRFRPSALLLLDRSLSHDGAVSFCRAAACSSLPRASGGAVFSHAPSFLRCVALSARHGARKAEGDFAPAFPLPLR